MRTEVHLQPLLSRPPFPPGDAGEKLSPGLGVKGGDRLKPQLQWALDTGCSKQATQAVRTHAMYLRIEAWPCGQGHKDAAVTWGGDGAHSDLRRRDAKEWAPVRPGSEEWSEGGLGRPPEAREPGALPQSLAGCAHWLLGGQDSGWNV